MFLAFVDYTIEGSLRSKELPAPRSADGPFFPRARGFPIHAKLAIFVGDLAVPSRKPIACWRPCAERSVATPAPESFFGVFAASEPPIFHTRHSDTVVRCVKPVPQGGC